MEDESQETASPQSASDAPPPVLGYRTPRDERTNGKASALDVVFGVFAIFFGTGMGILAAGTAADILRHRGEDLERFAAITFLLICGVAACTRSAWFYLGGWAQADDGGKKVRTIVLPWRWR